MTQKKDRRSARTKKREMTQAEKLIAVVMDGPYFRPESTDNDFPYYRSRLSSPKKAPVMPSNPANHSSCAPAVPEKTQ